MDKRRHLLSVLGWLCLFQLTLAQNGANSLRESYEKNLTVMADASGFSHSVFSTRIADLNEPDCPPPLAVSARLNGGAEVAIDWEDIPASYDGARYQIRYQMLDANRQPTGDWITIWVMDGNQWQLTRLADQGAGVQLEIRKICDGAGEDFTLASEWVTAGNFFFENGESRNGFPQLPSFVCGDDPPPPPPGGEYGPLIGGTTNDIFYIAGFPIGLDDLIPESGLGFYSGRGVIPLPFGIDKYVQVEFENIYVNNHFEVESGEIRAISDDPGNYPGLYDLGPINLGGEICVDPPQASGFDDNGIYWPDSTNHDPFGFSADGVYVMQPPYPGWVEGMPYDSLYDPCGFDANGIHRETGTTYNPDGCSQAGFDASQQPCTASPCQYYWLQDEELPITQEGANYATAVEDSIRPLVLSALDTLGQIVADSIASRVAICGALRSDMETIVTDLGFERIFVFGPEDAYFKPGMHAAFETAPTPLSVNIADRNEDVALLESKHVTLYECDLVHYRFLRQDSIINVLSGTDEVDIAVDEILDLLRSFPQPFIDSLNATPNGLYTWIYQVVYQNVKDAYNQQYDDQLTDTSESDLEDGWVFSSPSYQALEPLQPFANVTSWQVARDHTIYPKNKAEDILFQYRQGWRMINGEHRAHYLEALVKERSRRLAFGTGNGDENLLPITIENEINGIGHIVYLDNIRFSTEGARVDIFFVQNIPSSGKKLVFEAYNVGFGTTGFGDGATRLALGTDIGFRLSNAARLTVLGSGDTFVTVDCDGFTGMGIDGEVEFCRKYLIPLDENSLDVLPEPERVTGRFTTTMPSWGELIAEISITPFAVKNAEDIKWVVNDAIIDLSDSETPSNIAFPANYDSPFVQNGNASPLWRGFYLGEMSATLSNRFKQDGAPSIEVGVQNIIIDNMGFTGTVYANNLLDLNDGNLGGWAFSIEDFSVNIVANQLAGAGFGGLVHVPLLSAPGSNNNGGDPQAADCIGYTASILPGSEYNFTVETLSPKRLDLWKADANLKSGSKILITQNNDGFKVEALLHADIEIQGDVIPGMNLDIAQITFENLRVSNQAPYFSPGSWSFPAELGVDFGGFGITLSEIGCSEDADANEISLGFDGLIRLTGNGDSGGNGESGDGVGLTAGGGFEVIGEMVTYNDRQRWRFKRFQVNDAYVEGSFPGAKVEGYISFYDDNDDYGRGFQGIIGAEFEGLGIEIDAVGQFGKKDNYKYFFVDAMVNLTERSIPLGGLDLIGFGGGVYYHMDRPPSSSPALPTSPSTGTPSLPVLGQSLSGIIYTPNAEKGLGLKATVVLATASNRKIFNGNATFEILFYDGGGISDIWFYGNGRFMEDMDIAGAPAFASEGKPNNGAALSAYVDIHAAFGEERTLDANFEVYMNVFNVLKGGKGNELYGGASLHFGPDGWFIKVGTPVEQNIMSFGIPGIGELASVQSYFMVGNMDLPPMPDLPANVAHLTNSTNFMAAESTRATGRGLAFGASLHINTGEITFLIFYAALEAGLGFDVMLQDYGDARCAGSSSPIGINGWYASGQAWAYVEGDIGIKVKIFGKTKRYSILNVGAAAVLQAKLPNPFWARGAVGGYYRILGGLVKGRCNFEFTIGESCQIVGAGDPLESLKLILDINPGSGAENVSVGTRPTVTFNVPVEEAFELNTLDGSITLTAKVHQAQILYNGYDYPSTYTLSSDGTSLEILPREMLPANDSVQVKVVVDVIKNGVVEKTEEKIVTIYTGDRLDHIPDYNVLASYPLNTQFNFYKDEAGNDKGYIMLKSGQPDLFNDVPEGYYIVMQLYKNTQFVANLWHNYLEEQNKLEFYLPTQLLDNDHYYQLKLVYRPSFSGDNDADEEVLANTSGSTRLGSLVDDEPPFGGGLPTGGIDSNLDGNNTGGPLLSDGGAWLSDESDPEPEAGPSGPVEQLLYHIKFRVSNYNTFEAKVNSFTTVNLGYNYSAPMEGGTEPFDVFELEGTPEFAGLLSLEGQMIPWLTDVAEPDMYSLIPFEELVLFNNANEIRIDFERDPAELGILPYKAVYPAQSIDEIRFVQNHLSAYPSVMNIFDSEAFVPRIRYRVGEVVRNDQDHFRELCKMALVSLWADYYYDPNAPDDLSEPFPGTGGENFPSNVGSSSVMANIMNNVGVAIAEENPPWIGTYGLAPVQDLMLLEDLKLPAGTYPVTFKYTLPGQSQPSTIMTVEVNKNHNN